MTDAPKPYPYPKGQMLVILAGGLALFALALTLIPLTYSAWYNGRIFPGVSVAGLDLSGHSLDEAALRLSTSLTFDQQGKLYFQDGSQVWQVAPDEIGMLLDDQASAAAAYAVGRSGNPLTRLFEQLHAYQKGIDLPPTALYNERLALTYLQGLASEIDRPVVDASLAIDGIDVKVRDGQIGRTLDIAAALENLREQLPRMTDAIIPLEVVESAPVILDASAQAGIARQILSAPLVLRLPAAGDSDPGPWTIAPEALADWLTIARIEGETGASYQVQLDMQALRASLQGLAPSLVRNPANPRFTFNDETSQLELIQPAIIGRSLDVESSILLIDENLIAGEHQIDLVISSHEPGALDTSTAEDLGVRELVSVYTSYFYGSSAARIQNITTAAERFHGVLVAPGESFSMASVLGDVSLDSGYAEALIIYGDRTIKGVGGGVCQVSTTLFRTVFFGGYPVDERYAHAYRVSYYELTASGGIDSDLAGLDATVFAPVVDFKFSNNSDNWLLMETYVNPAARTLTWKFYSTDDGRSVEWETSGPLNLVEAPEDAYEENPELGKGEIKQIDWAAQGADVSVTRTVYRDGAVFFTDGFNTHYLPWQARYQYGPGTEGIPGQDDPGEEEDE